MTFQGGKRILGNNRVRLGGGNVEHIDVIVRIIEAEREARQTTETLRARRDHLSEELGVKKLELRDSIRENAEKKIREVIDRETAEADIAVLAIEKQFAEELANTGARLSERRDEWVETLFRRIVGL